MLSNELTLCGKSISMEEFRRKIKAWKNYYKDFYYEQDLDVRAKLNWTIEFIKTTKIVPDKYLKHLQGTTGLYEIRARVGSNIFRIFCFFDDGNLIVLINGFQKKDFKTPLDEIKTAEKLKKEYYENK